MLPTRVLPSNAPPLPDDGLSLTQRVLREQSHNAQHTNLPWSTGFDQKFSAPTEFEQKPLASLLNENTYAHPQQRHVNQQLQHPRPQYQRTWKYGHNYYGHGHFSPEREAKNQVEAEYLYRRFRQSDPYVKYRNRQQKEDKGNEENKWPDHLEKAFFRALVTWQPMGRRKILYKDKQRGRNELIADCIEDLTGERRTRKQVSSHIQVLKPFVEQDPYIMRFLSKEDLCAKIPHNGHGSVWGGGRRMSHHPVNSLPHAIRGTLASLSRTSNYDIPKLKQSPDVFEPVEFEMFVQQTFKDAQSGHDTQDPRRLHTYTRSGRSDLPPRDQDLYIDDWQRIERDFPLLATLNNQGMLDCNVIAAEATLAFPTQTFKGQDGGAIPGVELGIKFLCSSRLLPATLKPGSSPVSCKNTFYVNGVVVVDDQNPQTTEVCFERNPSRPHVLDTQIKFGSTFWAKNLGQMASKLLSPTKDYSDEVAAQIKSISAVQEISIATDCQRERLLVIYWTFRQSTKSEGAARWRRLVLPSATHQSSQLDVGIGQENYAKVETRSDSLFDSYSQYVDMPAAQSQQQLPLPTLLSPFEYDSSSGSALSSATWPTSGSEIGAMAHQSGQFDFATDNGFDFNAGNINISYDHNFDFTNLDSSAFDFGADPTDFAADPTLEDYSQSWADSTAAASFDTQPDSAIEVPTSFMALPTNFQPQTAVYDHAYDSQYSQHSYPDVSEQHSFQDNTPHDQQVFDQQAYGGAGQEIKVEDGLGALADASHLASALDAPPF